VKAEKEIFTVKCFVDYFIGACVIQERKERFFSLNKNEKKFQKIIDQLDHLEVNLCIEEAINIANLRCHSEIINRFDLNGNENVFAISTIRAMKSGVHCALVDALSSLFKIGNGSIIGWPSSSPKFFFYFGEDVSAQYYWNLDNLSQSGRA